LRQAVFAQWNRSGFYQQVRSRTSRAHFFAHRLHGLANGSQKHVWYRRQEYRLPIKYLLVKKDCLRREAFGQNSFLLEKHLEIFWIEKKCNINPAQIFRIVMHDLVVALLY
jgi:hypothetical protein